MAGTTDLFLITGFLGSGKTTFLNRIINVFPADRKLTILMNEFGEVGMDGTLVEGDAIDMLEISRGSIFCVCVKTDFIKGLHELHTKVQPDVLIIESTGVANPTDLKRDIALPIFQGRFLFREQFCIIDAEHFLEAFEIFASVEKQLATSTVFVLNKSDRADGATIDVIREKIAKHHPEPKIFETTYGRIPVNEFFSVTAMGKDDGGKQAETVASLTADELEAYIDDLLDQPEGEVTPPDQLVSATYIWLGDDLDQLRRMAAKLPCEVVRAKGFVQVGHSRYLFSYVMGTWTLEPTQVPPEKIQRPGAVVFIGSIESMAELAALLDNPLWRGNAIAAPGVGEHP